MISASTQLSSCRCVSTSSSASKRGGAAFGASGGCASVFKEGPDALGTLRRGRPGRRDVSESRGDAGGGEFALVLFEAGIRPSPAGALRTMSHQPPPRRSRFLGDDRRVRGHRMKSPPPLPEVLPEPFGQRAR